MLVNSHILAVFLTIVASSSPIGGPVRLHTVLETNKQVVLSGQQYSGFHLKIRNRGLVPVLVSERQAGGVLQARGRFEPHTRGALHFATGSVAIVRSLDTREAEFDVKFFNEGVDGVNIRYESLSR